jgi:bile acid:Na+ symporter, BASS family
MDTLPTTVLIPLLIVTFMLQVGLAAPPGSFRWVRGSAIGRGLFVMLVLSPLVAAIVARVFVPAQPVIVALVLLSTVGVLPLASRGARAIRGSFETAVVLSLLLGTITIFTAVPTTRLLLPYSGHVEDDLFRPGALLFRVILLQGIPLVVGALIARTSHQAQAIEKVVARANLVILAVVVLSIVIPRLGVVASVGGRGVVATIVFAVVLESLAFFVGGPTLGERRAIASIANMANVGLALTIANAASAGRPYVELVLGVFLVRASTGKLLELLAARRISGGPRGLTASVESPPQQPSSG